MTMVKRQTIQGSSTQLPSNLTYLKVKLLSIWNYFHSYFYQPEERNNVCNQREQGYQSYISSLRQLQIQHMIQKWKSQQPKGAESMEAMGNLTAELLFTESYNVRTGEHSTKF